MGDVYDDRWRTRTLRGPEDAPVDDSRCYLLVVQGGSSAMFHLPSTGVVLIGRSEEADLRVDDDTASRNHAKIIIADGAARLHDLGSHNGTFVNGERVDATRALVSGDVIGIGAVTMVLHAQRRHREARAIVDAATLRLRLVEEIERATQYHRPMALVSVALPPSAEPKALAATIAAELRVIDVVGFVGDAQLAVLMPEAGADALALAERVARAGAGARVGLATCPDDALDPDTLMAVARAAAAAAQPGAVATAAAAARELELGDRTIVLADPALVRLFDLIARLAASDLPILILGETGAGKEGAARAVHHGSKRAHGPFVTVNCAAIPENLVESELFGYERGAFTGAVAPRAGKLEAASGGTLFLDEIGELPPNVQAKLLRAFEEKRITRLGDVKERPVDLRIVAATNRALEDEVKAGRFRQDLFFRLGAAMVVLPPLRDRPREIPILARRFLADACARAGREPPLLSPGTLQRLGAYAWPGNVRELRNAIEFVAATTDEDTIEPWHLPAAVTGLDCAEEKAAAAAPSATTAPSGAPFRRVTDELRELERTRMVEALQAAGGVQRRAAELIGMPLRTFVMKVKQYGISPRARSEP